MSQPVNGRGSFKYSNGSGRFKHSDDGEYDGEWRGGKMHGWGKCVFGGSLQGCTYKGKCIEDQRRGRGKYV